MNETLMPPVLLSDSAGKVIISCLPTVSTDGLGFEDVAQLTEKVREAMTTVYEATSREIHDAAVVAGTSIVMDDKSN